MEDKIDFIDNFLREHEDYIHGQESKDVTKCRIYLNDIKTELKKLRVTDVSSSVCECGIIAFKEMEEGKNICSICGKMF